VFYATVPLTTGVFAWLLGVQRLQRTHMIAAAVGLVGVAVIFAGEIRWGAPVPALLAVLSAAIVASLAGVILKRVPPHSSFVVNAIGAAIGACVCLFASLLLGEPRALPRSAAAWAPILYLTMAGSMGAFVLYAWLVSQWKVTRVSVGALIIPVIAVLVGALVRGESPAPSTYAGAALVLVGVSVSLFGGRITPRRGS
jgi:drug/metabolite transporter (DMT)-like permease